MLITRILRTNTRFISPSTRAITSLSPRFQNPIQSKTKAAMSTLTPPVPIVLIGIHTEIGAPVAEGLRPEWDVIRFIQTFTAAKSDLPSLLHGEAPPSPPTNTVGSHSYSRPARAVLFGRGFTQAQAEELFNLYKNETPVPAEEGGVLWAAGAEDKRPKDLEGMVEPPRGIEGVMVKTFKGLLEDWKERVEGGRDIKEKGKEGKEGELVLY
ncbi:hypothetical protein F5Y01DRAFT_34928 [Xylaria sp. FL0043]|nr:hypothetical protein F5Y01DRAFT_34928 [Xylaria sp. FL0043]